MRGVRADIGTLEGRLHESFYRDKAASIFGVFLRGGREAKSQVADQLHNARANDMITRDELVQVLASELLWIGRTRNDGREVVFVVQASWLAQLNDVDRAQVRVAILRRIGIQAYAVTAGDEWSDDAMQVAQDVGVMRITNGSIDVDSWENAQAHFAANGTQRTQ